MYRIMLICEKPESNTRKMWYAYSTAPVSGIADLEVGWGRIPPGETVDIETLYYTSQRTQTLRGDAAETQAFLSKKIREKLNKGYCIVDHKVGDRVLRWPGAPLDGVIPLKTRTGRHPY